jgi:hypothetical protein
MWRWRVILAAVLTLSALSGVGAYQLVRPALDRGRAEWREIAWAFPRDGWPAGRAFRCDGCGEGAELYVRAKIGFCNCDTGVADDDEVDRVADLDLISEKFAPADAGKVVRVAGMAGRSRRYALNMPDGARAAIGIALSHRCDLMVAVVQGKSDATELQRAALDYLASEPMHHWMTAALGGR